MSDDKKKLKKGKQLAQGLLSQDECNDLDAFCSSIQLDEINFQSWCHQHENLDLEIPLVVSEESLSFPFHAVVKFSRQIRTQSAHGHTVVRIKVEQGISLETRKDLEKPLVFPGMGDTRDGRSGDLRVIIRIKP